MCCHVSRYSFRWHWRYKTTLTAHTTRARTLYTSLSFKTSLKKNMRHMKILSDMLLWNFYLTFTQMFLSVCSEQSGWSQEVQISCQDGVHPNRLMLYQLTPTSLHSVEYGLQEGCMHVAQHQSVCAKMLRWGSLCVREKKRMRWGQRCEPFLNLVHGDR